MKRLPKFNVYGHPLRPLWERLWLKVRYPGVRFSKYAMPPCPYDDELENVWGDP